MWRASLLLAVLVLLSPQLASGQGAVGFQPREENEVDFPDHPGRAETFGFCSACHGFRIVAAQGMTREQWDSSLTWMSDRHSMPPIDAADREVMLDYLAKAFPPRTPAGGRPGWRNPFAPQ